MNLNLEHVRVPAGCPRSTPLAVLSRFAAAPQIDAKNGRYTACATAIVRVTVRRVSRVQNHGVCSPRACACVRAPLQLRDGVSHEDVGCGCSERQPSKSAAIENAKKVCVVAGLCGCVCVRMRCCVCACVRDRCSHTGHRRCAAVRCDGRTETSPSAVRAAAGQLPCKQGPRAQCQCYVAADAAKEACAAIRDCGGYSVQHP